MDGPIHEGTAFIIQSLYKSTTSGHINFGTLGAHLNLNDNNSLGSAYSEQVFRAAIELEIA